MPIITVSRYTREDARRNPHVKYVFGDNMERVGRGGQAAAMRDEPNAIGIPTLWKPGKPFDDKDFDTVKITIYHDFLKVKEHLCADGIVVLPADGIGTGLAALESNAPKIFDYIQRKWDLLLATYSVVKVK